MSRCSADVEKAALGSGLLRRGRAVTWPHGDAVAGQEPRSRNSALLSDSTARTAHANLVRRAEKRSKESATWQPAARKIETALGLNTEHKA